MILSLWLLVNIILYEGKTANYVNLRKACFDFEYSQHQAKLGRGGINNQLHLSRLIDHVQDKREHLWKHEHCEERKNQNKIFSVQPAFPKHNLTQFNIDMTSDHFPKLR